MGGIFRISPFTCANIFRFNDTFLVAGYRNEIDIGWEICFNLILIILFYLRYIFHFCVGYPTQKIKSIMNTLLKNSTLLIW